MMIMNGWMGGMRNGWIDGECVGGLMINEWIYVLMNRWREEGQME